VAERQDPLGICASLDEVFQRDVQAELQAIDTGAAKRVDDEVSVFSRPSSAKKPRRGSGSTFGEASESVKDIFSS